MADDSNVPNALPEFAAVTDCRYRNNLKLPECGTSFASISHEPDHQNDDGDSLDSGRPGLSHLAYHTGTQARGRPGENTFQMGIYDSFRNFLHLDGPPDGTIWSISLRFHGNSPVNHVDAAHQ
jgi:hypothetical protein